MRRQRAYTRPTCASYRASKARGSPARARWTASPGAGACPGSPASAATGASCLTALPMVTASLSRGWDERRGRNVQTGFMLTTSGRHALGQEEASWNRYVEAVRLILENA